MKAHALIIAAVVFISNNSRADVPPPPDYVEQCTPQKQAASSRTCEACATSRLDAAGSCGTKLGAGFAFRCRARGGATAWTEVWCRAGTIVDAGTVDGGLPVSPAGLDGGANSSARPLARISEGSGEPEASGEPSALEDAGCSALGGRASSGLWLVALLGGLLIARRKRA